MSNETDKKEDKGEKFRRLAKGRVSSAIGAIRKIGNLSNSNFYSYTPAEVNKIIKALKNEVDSLEEEFKRGNRGKPDFTF